MTTALKHSAKTIKSLFARMAAWMIRIWRRHVPARPRVIELEYRRRTDSGTRRSAVIHVESRSRRRRD